MKFGAILFSAALGCLSLARAGDWPQWRGPERNGISTETVRSTWPPSGPPVLWRASIGIGFSSLSISRGRVCAMGNTNEQDTVWCFDARTGRELWKFSYAARLDPQYYEGGPGATPTIDGGRVFTIGKWGDVCCLDAATGAVVWRQDLRQAGLKPNRWGFAGSPLIWRDLVILNAGAAGIALERGSGRIAWSTGTNAAGYASPVLLRSGDAPVALIFAAKHLVAINPQTGRELWRFPWETKWDTNNSDPLVHPKGVFLSSFSRGSALISVQDPAPALLYQTNSLYNHLSPGILLGDYLYAFNGEAKFKTDFRCLHVPTGATLWSEKDPAFGSLICAGGRLIILSEKGELCLAEVSPSGFKMLARAAVLPGVCWTPPALADGLLYARNAQGELRCLDLRPAVAPR